MELDGNQRKALRYLEDQWFNRHNGKLPPTELQEQVTRISAIAGYVTVMIDRTIVAYEQKINNRGQL